MVSRLFILCGALAPGFYILAAIIGGELLPGYNHITHSVSDLLAEGAPNKALLDMIMLFSNLFTIIGSAAVIVLFRKTFDRKVLAGFALLLLTGLFSILSAYVFRLPHQGEMTVSGVIHIGLVILLVLLTLAAILILGLNLPKRPGWAWFQKYSVVTFALFLFFGLVSPVIINLNVPVVGLVERLGVGVYYQWVVVLFIQIYKIQE